MYSHDPKLQFLDYEGLLITLLFMMGFSFTSTTALAMECEREHAGTARLYRVQSALGSEDWYLL